MTSPAPPMSMDVTPSGHALAEERNETRWPDKGGSPLAPWLPLVLTLLLICALLIGAAPADADVMLDVPAFAQTDYPGPLGYVPGEFAKYGCGVTSMAMVFKYYGCDTDPRRLNNALRDAGGFTSAKPGGPADLLTWSAASITAGSGGKVKLVSCMKGAAKWSLIDADLAAGRPVMVLLSNKSRKSRTHFIVVVGKKGSQYYINDSYSGHKSIRFEQNILKLGTDSVTEVVRFSGKQQSPSPAGTIAFVRDGDIWTMKGDGSGQRNLTNTFGVEEWSPSWSPHGDRIAFIRGTGSAAPTTGWPCGRAMTAEPSGIDVREVRLAFEDQADSSKDLMTGVAWSPDGKSLALSSVTDALVNTCRLLLADADTGQVRQLYSPDLGVVRHLRWKPDGTRVAMTWAYGGSLKPGLQIVDTATGQLAGSLGFWMPSEDIGYGPLTAAWSPSSSEIAYIGSSDKHLLQEFETKYFLALGSATGSSHKLIDSCSSRTRTLGTVAWSPNGAYLTYSTQQSPGASDSAEVRIVDVKSGRAAAIVPSASEPAWGP